MTKPAEDRVAGEFNPAGRLNEALLKARSSQFAEEEIPALTGLAELRRLQGDCRASRDMLDLAKEVASRGPYPLLLADALNVSAQIERDEGDAPGWRGCDHRLPSGLVRRPTLRVPLGPPTGFVSPRQPRSACAVVNWDDLPLWKGPSDWAIGGHSTFRWATVRKNVCPPMSRHL